MDTIEAGARAWPSRREVLALGLGAFVVLALPWRRAHARLVRRTVPVMGTIAELAVVHRDARYAHGALDAAAAELRRVERAMTRFDAGSEVGRANRHAAADAVAIGPATAFVLAEALRWAETSDGAFDPCLGRAVELWDVTHRHQPPEPAQVRRLAGRRLYHALDLDRWRGRRVVRFHDPDVALDLGGIAKGFGVDRAVAALRDWGMLHALVNVGGDLYALGDSPEGDPWRVGIRSLEDAHQLAGTFEVSNQAVATSGDYQQYFEYGGRRYHHLIDPGTAAPRVSAVHSVTIVADSCLHADAAATATFGMRPDGAAALLRACAAGARLVRPG